jgi:hypothetical protein
MKVERSKNRLYYLDLDRVDPICDGFLVKEQRSAPFLHESTHITQDIICEKGKLGKPKGSPENSRPPWPEGGGLKGKRTPEEDPVKDIKKEQKRYVATQSSCSEPSKQAKQRVHSEAKRTCCEARRKWAARRGSVRGSRKKRTQ